MKEKFNLISKNKLVKKLLVNKKSKAGRNNFGRITIRHRERGTKKKFRIMDYYRSLWYVPGYIIKFEYDPNRNTLISFVTYFCGVISYIISVEGMLIGDIILSGCKIFLRSGDCSPLKFIPINAKINNIEYRKNCGSQLIRASGCFGKVIFKNQFLSIIKLMSGKLKQIDLACIATLGIIFNFNFYLFRYKTAGLLRRKGFRPCVRGVAMNPVDHPYGGGEGKKSKKKICMSPWGKLIKGKKTRKKNLNNEVTLKRYLFG